MAAPAAVALVHTTLNEISRVYPKGLLRWVKTRRLDLKELLEAAEQRVEEAAQAWRPNQPREEDSLQEALDGLRWAYAEAIAAYHVKSSSRSEAMASEMSFVALQPAAL